jgi:large subunit ribosomal protein L32e
MWEGNVMVTFLRRGNKKFSKLGLRRKKKQVWRRPNGRDNKMREKVKGYPAVVSVGYKNDKALSGNIREKEPIMINNLNDLKKMKDTQIGIVGDIGKKKKIEIAEFAKKEGKALHNLNPEKYLAENAIKVKKKEETASKTTPTKDKSTEVKK